MALILSATKTSITTDCGTIVVTDSTGTYDVTTNPNGYGAPNETRANLYLKVCLSLRKSTGREDITIDDYNDNTASTWSITVTEDGWYEIYFFACKAWSGATTYQLNYVIYDASTDLYYKSLQASNLNNAVTDTDWWESTNDVEDFTAAIIASQPDAYETTTNFVEQCNTRKCEANMLLKAKCDCCDSNQLQEYEKVRMKMEAVAIHEADDNFTEAQEIVENLQDICINLEDCNCH